jgi:hypothetical protein
MPPRVLTAPGGTLTIQGMNAAHKFSPIGCVYGGKIVTGGAPGEENTVRFTVPNKDLVGDATSYDSQSFITTALPVTALGALRSIVLVFHAGSVERIRGTIPPNSANSNSDMWVEPIFDRQGCIDPMTVAYWNENCLFADEHGLNLTDGSIVRNLSTQGSIRSYWRQLWQNKLTVAGNVFLDYYILTVRRTDSVVDTLVCDLNSRQWFRLSNIPALTFIASQGGQNMERVWAGLAGKGRLARLGPCFFPAFSTTQNQDDDGTAVMPEFETPWYRVGPEGYKRARFAYLSYDARSSGTAPTRDEIGMAWRFRDDDDDPELGLAPLPAPDAKATIDQLLQISWIRSPQQSTYTTIGSYPSTTRYMRYRLPLGQLSYGFAFKVAQIAPSTVTRIFDLALEQRGIERGRV